MTPNPNRKREFFTRIYYLIADALAGGMAYTLVYLYRKFYIDSFHTQANIILWEHKYFYALVLIIFFWLLVYYVSGFYSDILRRSRLKELFSTFRSSFAGSLIIFFSLFLDDWVSSYQDYYKTFFIYLSTHFTITYFFRFLLSSHTNKLIQNRIISFPTLIIGSNAKAVELYEELTGRKKTTGNNFIGFLSVNNNIQFLLSKQLAYMGNYTELKKVIDLHGVQEVILAVESKEHDKVQEIINLIENEPVSVKMIPDTYDILSGKVKLESVGEPLVELPINPLTLPQRVSKRIFDIMVSFIGLIISFPVFIFTALMVKASSQGPIFFLQERVGYRGTKFKIIKFRSMICNAESNGPQLSSEHDPRITSWGRIMRKYRLDELPQLINVLSGEMSIIGPRPEREFYINQIVKTAPYYKQLHRIKPGITSWGMVKFGYAETVEEMVQRLRYDLIYLENVNLLNDLKILLYTVLIVLQGRGK